MKMKHKTLTEFMQPTDPTQLFHDKLASGDFQTQHEKIFHRLLDNAPHFAHEFTREGIMQYNARIKELKEGKNRIGGTGVVCNINNFTNEEKRQCFIMNGFEEKR